MGEWVFRFRLIFNIYNMDFELSYYEDWLIEVSSSEDTSELVKWLEEEQLVWVVWEY